MVYLVKNIKQFMVKHSFFFFLFVLCQVVSVIVLLFSYGIFQNFNIVKKEAIVGIADLINKDVNKLSGGQKQRVAIARAIVNEPSIILADEPTGALDSKTSEEIMNLFKTLNENGKTIVIVTHDINIAEKCERIIEISDGLVV